MPQITNEMKNFQFSDIEIPDLVRKEKTMEVKNITNFIFGKLQKLCASCNFDFAYTKDHFSVGRINNSYLLKEVLTLLNVQSDYEIFVETQRIDNDIYYFVSGERIDVE